MIRIRVRCRGVRVVLISCRRCVLCVGRMCLVMCVMCVMMCHRFVR